MKLLAIETSTDACSCALLVGDECRERFSIAPRRHGELILPMAEELLAEAGLTIKQIDGLAFGRGPGAFTGVRIAAGVVQGIAFATGLPVAPVSSLRALAQGALREDGEKAVLAAFDARMREVYWGVFKANPEGLMETVMAEAVTPPDQVAVEPEGDLFGAGSGWSTYGEILRVAVGGVLTGFNPGRHPHAWDVATLGRDGFARGEVVAAEEALPVYVRDEVVRQKR